MRNYNADIAYAQRDCPDFLKGSYQADPQEIAYIVSNPMQWLAEKQKSRKKYDNNAYLVTFTRNPNSKHNLEAWLKRIDKEINKSFVVECVTNIENHTTNIHCHAIIIANRQVQKKDFKVFERDYGYVDVKRKKIDNGMEEYIVKDMPEGFTPIDKIDFLNYFNDQLKELELIK